MGILFSRANSIRRSRRGIIARASGVSRGPPSATKAFCISITINADRRGCTVKKSLPETLGLEGMAFLLSALPLGLLPDIAVMHELDLAFDHFLFVLGVFHRLALEIQILGIDRFLIDDLAELRAEVFHPVVPLGAGAMIAQGLDVNHAGHITRTSAVFQLSDLLTLIVEDVGAAPEGINRCRLFGEKVIRSEIGRDDIHVVVERSRRTLDFKEVI